jgi:hypothetical protein
VKEGGQFLYHVLNWLISVRQNRILNGCDTSRHDRQDFLDFQKKYRFEEFLGEVDVGHRQNFWLC